MKKILLSLLLAAGSMTAGAVVPQFGWGKNLFAGAKIYTSFDQNLFTTDGNIVVAGRYKTTSDLMWGTEALDIEESSSTLDFNLWLSKIATDGNVKWYIYSKVGNFKTVTLKIAPTSDGGVVLVARVRHNAAEYTDENLLEIVDGVGNVVIVEDPVAPEGLRQDFGLVARVSAEGEILWTQMISQGSVLGEKTGIVDSFTISALTVDDKDNIYLGGRYITELTLPGNVVLPTGRNIPASNTSTSVSVGDNWLAKLDAQTGTALATYYAGMDNIAKYAESDEVQGLQWRNGTLYVSSLVKGLTDTEANIFGNKLAPVAYQQVVVGAFDGSLIETEFPVAKYVNNVPTSLGNSNSVTVQINGFSASSENIYVEGCLKGAMEADGINIASAAAWLEGYYLKFNALDGTLVGAGIAGHSISDFHALVDDEEAGKVYTFGYNLSNGYVMQTFDASATTSGDVTYLVTSSGTIGTPSASFNNDTKQLVISAQSNKQVSFYGTEEKGTEGIGTFTGFVASFILPGVNDSNSGVEPIEEEIADAPAEYYNLQGVRVANPGNGIYIVRRGAKVTKEVIR